MPILVLGFLLGVLALQGFTILPAKYWVFVLLIFSLVVMCVFRRYSKHLLFPLMVILGFAWCLWYAHAQLVWTFSSELEGRTIGITGYIASIPEVSEEGDSFLFSLRKIEGAVKSRSARGLVKLSIRDAHQDWRVGDKWALSVRLKKPYGTMNPGGFDYEAWAMQAGVRANGYVVTQVAPQRLSHHEYRYVIDRMRQYFKEAIAANLKPTQTSSWITALAIGERNNIASEDWQVLRNTGTNHLMAIAGLHIGLMSALAHAIAAWCWRRSSRFSLKFPASHVGALAALGMALLYSALAGFSIPTQRASIMLFIFLIVILMRRHIPVWHAWSCALFVVLCINPLSVLTESFCLSFGSVALIIYGVSGRVSPKGLWWKWGRIQWVIALGLIPLSLVLFHQCSLVSFVANSIAIPWVGFIVVPLCLLGCFCLLFSAKLGAGVLFLADKILGVLWGILMWFSHLSGVVWYQGIPSIFLQVVSVLAMIFLLLPVGAPGRYLGFLAFLPILLFKPEQPAQAQAWVSVLDVGQGLSVVVQTHHHVLVFDAGPRSSANFDMGDSVVVPFLHFIGVKQVDAMVISHGDNDHIGGAQAIMRQFPVLSIKTSRPELFKQAQYCLRGEHWEWDGVQFAFLHPTPALLGLGNNSSCVLRVGVGGQHILLTGDIEKLAEKDLVRSVSNSLSSSILVAPHHGSKTSAIADFVSLVHPNYVVFPVGYRNRYHFPHQSVVEKYLALRSILLQIDKTGALQFRLTKQKILLPPISYRLQHKHYWNN